MCSGPLGIKAPRDLEFLLQGIGVQETMVLLRGGRRSRSERGMAAGE